jgi:hypothetical protein
LYADGTWPGLLDVFLGFLQREVLEARRQLDATGNKVLRRIFTEADNPDRCGEMVVEKASSGKWRNNTSSSSSSSSAAAAVVHLHKGRQP